jgi:hypothetical protein
MKNIYKSKVAKAYHRHNLFYKLEYLFFVIPVLSTVLVIVPIIGGIGANKNIPEIQVAIICVSVFSVAILIAIIPGLYNDSYTDTELSNFHLFARKYFAKQSKREYKRRERKNKKWIM